MFHLENTIDHLARHARSVWDGIPEIESIGNWLSESIHAGADLGLPQPGAYALLAGGMHNDNANQQPLQR